MNSFGEYQNNRPSRRDFLRIAGIAASGLAAVKYFPPAGRFPTVEASTSTAPAFAQALPQIIPPLVEFPTAERLGRAARGSMEEKEAPSLDSATVTILYEDSVLPWLREVVASTPTYVFNNQRWVETPEGFVYAPNFQPVRYLLNQPVTELPNTTLGPGMWVEVTIPYVDVALEREPSSNSWVDDLIEAGLPVRVYDSQVFWVDRVETGQSGRSFYHINPNFYGGVDMLWADARAFRPIPAEDLAPINPDVENKKVVVDVTHQALSCYEGDTEVFYCRVSTGAKFDMYGNVVDKWATPVGKHKVSRKFISLQMAGGTTGAGYDLPGIGWTVIFATGGVAIHSTFWHNNFGDPMSHGCVNVAPDDAKWLFRWIQPAVSADPGMWDIGLSGQTSTEVEVIEA
jgi:lipoprotein-anchoring transpeptidase ErfK/SrfK